jgi:hypothetical protein
VGAAGEGFAAGVGGEGNGMNRCGGGGGYYGGGGGFAANVAGDLVGYGGG